MNEFKKLKPIFDKNAYSRSVAQMIEYEFWKNIYEPVLAILKEKDIRLNAVSSQFRKALISGEISYIGEHFYGKFNSVISRELRSMGAKFNKTLKAYKLELSRVPVEIRDLIAQGRMGLLKKEEDINKKLVELGEKKFAIDFKQRASDIIGDLNKQFTKTVLPSDIEIPFDAEHLKVAYEENLNTYISDWTSTAIFRLRSKVSDQVAKGFRADETSKVIQAEFGVTKNKAKFLARQETSLLVSAYREQKYTAAGYNEYIWTTSHDERVRQSHKDLNGRKFAWTSPPVVDPATGRKGHPGQDFNCRCIAIPVIRIGV